MKINENIIVQVSDYNRVDGRNAYNSTLKKITLGAPVLEENKSHKIAMQLWREVENGSEKLQTELEIHQVMDLMIILGRTMAYFREAYRIPGLYDKNNPTIDRIGLQGDAASLEIAVENPHIDAEIAAFSDALSQSGELTGERLRVLGKILDELEI